MTRWALIGLACLAMGALGGALGGCATSPALSATSRPFAGRTVVITGASSGFGKGIALAMGARGANVVLAARRVESLEAVATQIRQSGGQAVVAPTDVSRAAEMARLADTAAAAFGRIDVWINDAGVIAMGRYDEIPLADNERVVDVNLKGVMYGSYEALRRFRRQGAGVLINMGSVESVVPLPYQASYVASKHAILGLDSALNQELRLAGERNIRVVTVMPWGADTPIWAHGANYTGHRARAPMLDGPDKIVRAVLAAAYAPRPRVAVGWKAKAAVAGHQLAPLTTETTAADVFHRYLYEKAPADVAPTTGNLYAPMAGDAVDAGLRTRWKLEDAAASRAPLASAPH